MVLRDRARKAPDLIVVNTHLRYGERFAIQCVERLRAIIGKEVKKYPRAEVVLMGYMNHDRTSKVYAALAGGAGAAPADGGPRLMDTFDYSQKGPREAWGNYHGFTGRARGIWPTDLIFVRGVMTHSAAELVRDKSAEGRYPSDHFFVWTTLTPK